MNQDNKMLRFTASWNMAITFSSLQEWNEGKSNLTGQSPNAVRIRNISYTDAGLAGNQIRVNGSLVEDETEIIITCQHPGGVININELKISLPQDEGIFEVQTIVNNTFYFQELIVKPLPAK